MINKILFILIVLVGFDVFSKEIKEKPPIVKIAETKYLLLSPKELFLIGLKKEYTFDLSNPYILPFKPYFTIGEGKGIAGINIQY